MGLQQRLLFLPDDAVKIGDFLAMVRNEGQITFIEASGPIFTCRENDETAVRLAAAIFTAPGVRLATPSQVAEALGRHRSRVHDYRSRYQAGGTPALEVKRRGPRGPSKLKGTVLTRAQELLDEGLSNRGVAQEVGVSEQTIRGGIKDGRLVRATRRGSSGAQPSAENTGSTPRQRSDEDAVCPGGLAVKREEERAEAVAGMLVEAPPVFEAAESVSKAGVLVALPALLGQGLVDVGQRVYGGLKNGYYGLHSMLLTFALMALLRIKSIEGLSTHAPGEFGRVLGLDRAPEMKTVRRKLAELAERSRALDFAGGFSQRWAEEDPEAIGYLYLDGHVRPYHGHKYRLPKTKVPQRRLCMPATTDYWVNDANAEPLLFVTAPANDGLLAMMDNWLLPEIRNLAGEGRRITLVFDREGWSPQRFQEWHEVGFDVITYRKGKQRDWRQHCFKETTVGVGSRSVNYQLAERMVRVSKGFRMREIRCLCEDGHQTSVVTTRRDLPIGEVAVRMFSRWKQENYFRYMRHEFALDQLPTTAVEPANPERTVPNPALKERKRELAKAKLLLGKAEQAYGKMAHDNQEQKRRTMRGFKISHAELGQRIKELRLEVDRLEVQIRALPVRVPVREVMDGMPVVRLERERKTIIDTLKMVAYRAETQLANLVGPLLPSRDDQARKFMRQVFNLPADLLPDHGQGTLHVRLHSMTTPRDNRVLTSLCDVLNGLEFHYPGTELRVRLEAPPAPRESQK